MKSQIIFLLVLILINTQQAAAQRCNKNQTSSTPDHQFIVNGQEIIDTETGLIWQKCGLGRSGTDCLDGQNQVYNWEDALQAAENERQDTGKPWRLPNIKELLSIVETTCAQPSINLSVFPNTSVGFYRSSTSHSTPYVKEPSSAWYVVFNMGYSTSGRSKSEGMNVRLVRTGN